MTCVSVNPAGNVLRIVHSLPKRGIGRVQQLRMAGRLVEYDEPAVDELDEIIRANRAVAIRRRKARFIYAIVEVSDDADRLSENRARADMPQSPVATSPVLWPAMMQISLVVPMDLPIRENQI